MVENVTPIERFINELTDQGIKVITVAEVMKFAGKVEDADEKENVYHCACFNFYAHIGSSASPPIHSQGAR